MILPAPDFLTAFGMAAMSAFTVSWVMWALGKKFWQQGLSWAIISTLFYGCAYISFILQNYLNWIELTVISKLLISIAIATCTIALYRFCYSTKWPRDMLILLLPIICSVILAIDALPENVSMFNMLQSGITVVQTFYLLFVLLRMRSQQLGIGWVLMISATLMHLATIIPLIFTQRRPNPEFIQQASTGDILAMWAVCLVLFLKMVVTSFGFLVMLHDRQTALEKDKARLDYLTQLPNRATLVQALEQATFNAAQHMHPLALMVIDIDHFKRCNDQFGHLMGDRVIQVVAQILQQECRKTDLAGRYGGEEFVLLLPNTSLESAEILAQRLCKIVRETPIALSENQHLHISISIGVHCCVPPKNSTWEPLIEAADQAMYHAKKAGRDRVALSNA